MSRLRQLIRHELRADQSFVAFARRYHRWMIGSALTLGGTALCVGAAGAMLSALSVADHLWMVGAGALLVASSALLRLAPLSRWALPTYFAVYAVVVGLGTVFSAQMYPDPLHIWLFALLMPQVGTPLLLPLGQRVFSALYLGPVFSASFVYVRGPISADDVPPLVGAYLLSASAAVIAGDLLRRVAEANWEQAQEAVSLVSELEERVAERTARLEELSVKLMTTREHERAALARDLHDQMSQRLTGVRQFLFAAKNSDDPNAAVSQAEAVVDELHREVRDAVAFLGGVPLADDLLEGMTELCGRFEDATGVVVRLLLPAKPPGPPIDQVALAVLRESLTNVQRHATGATEVTVALKLSSETWMLVVTDDGPGPGEGNADGLGVLGMKARVRQVGGQLELEATEQGAHVRASFPITGHGVTR